MLSVGDTAPRFTLLDQDGNTVSLTDFLGKKVLVWFYPKASTPGCTAEGCNIRDNHAAFVDANVEILGISKDSVKRQKNFATKQNFPYRLLSDESGETVEAFGAWGPKGARLIKAIGQKIQNLTCEKRSTFFLFQSISMAIQRGNTASILGTVKSEKKLDEIFYL